jgi:hypothetical protein
MEKRNSFQSSTRIDYNLLTELTCNTYATYRRGERLSRVRLFLVTSLESAVRREGGLVRLPSPVVFFVPPMVSSMGMGFVLPAV